MTDPTFFPLIWRRTSPASDADFCVCDRYGVQLARVMKVEHGPQAGSWRWTARTQHLPNQGTEPTRDDAMAAAKKRWFEDPLSLDIPGSILP